MYSMWVPSVLHLCHTPRHNLSIMQVVMMIHQCLPDGSTPTTWKAVEAANILGHHYMQKLDKSYSTTGLCIVISNVFQPSVCKHPAGTGKEMQCDWQNHRPSKILGPHSSIQPIQRFVGGAAIHEVTCPGNCTTCCPHCYAQCSVCGFRVDWKPNLTYAT